MIAGHLLVSILVGVTIFFISSMLGASFWHALGFYTLSGVALMLVLHLRNILTTHDDTGDQPSGRNGELYEYCDHVAGHTLVDVPSAIKSPMRILVVDDDPFILDLVPKIAASAGFSTVTPVLSAELALNLLSKEEQSFDCMLLDINMPEMDGVELCRRIRQMPRYNEVPIVMLTAMRDIKHMGEAFRAGATDYATKPFDIEGLAQRLNLAQRIIQTRQNTRHLQTDDFERRRRPAASYNLQPLKGVRFMGSASLVDPSVFSTYLTQLPHDKLAEVQVLAVYMDGIDSVHSRSSSEQFISLLEDVAEAAVSSFGADRTLFAYTKDATLLIASNSMEIFSAGHIEMDIECRLQFKTATYDEGKGTGIVITVGGPVFLQGTKAERAGMVLDKAIGLAKSRAVDKLSVNLFAQLRR